MIRTEDESFKAGGSLGIQANGTDNVRSLSSGSRCDVPMRPEWISLGKKRNAIRVRTNYGFIDSNLPDCTTTLKTSTP